MAAVDFTATYNADDDAAAAASSAAADMATVDFTQLNAALREAVDMETLPATYRPEPVATAPGLIGRYLEGRKWLRPCSPDSSGLFQIFPDFFRPF